MSVCYLIQLWHLRAHWKNYWPVLYHRHSQCFSIDQIYSIEEVVKGLKEIANKPPSWILPITCCAPLVQHWRGGLAPSSQPHSTAAFLEIKCLPQTRLWFKNFVCTLFPTDHRNPFVSPLLGKFPYFFMTSKYWRYSCHISSFLTATSDN